MNDCIFYSYRTLMKKRTQSYHPWSQPRVFCEIYKAVIYGEENTVLKSEVLDCKQLPNENIDDYAFRLREKAFIAFPDEKDAEQNFHLTFVRGIREPYIKRRLNESSFANFESAVIHAKKLEKVEEIITEKPKITPILKETAVKFESSNDTQYSRPNKI